MADNFWTSKGVDPKRKYRFTVSLHGEAVGPALDSIIWFAKTVDKPEITVNTADVNFMQHKFYFPGTVEWNEISLVLTDPISPDAAAGTLEILKKMGYVGPSGALTQEGGMKSIQKSKSFDVVIKQVDAEGEAKETWTLNNAFLIKLAFGDLDYTSEDLSEITMTFRYDWASMTSPTAEYFPHGSDQGTDKKKK